MIHFSHFSSPNVFEYLAFSFVSWYTLICLLLSGFFQSIVLTESQNLVLIFFLYVMMASDSQCNCYPSQNCIQSEGTGLSLSTHCLHYWIREYCYKRNTYGSSYHVANIFLSIIKTTIICGASLFISDLHILC